MTYYDTLQIGKSADSELIEKAYKAVLQQAIKINGPEKIKKIEQIEEAYKILSNHAARRMYDISICISTKNHQPQPQPQPQHQFEAKNLEDDGDGDGDGDGAEKDSSKKFCTKCWERMHAGSKFCSNCGSPNLELKESPPPEKIKKQEFIPAAKKLGGSTFGLPNFFKGVIGIAFLLIIFWSIFVEDHKNKGLPPSANSNYTQQAPVFSQPVQPLPQTGDNTATFSNGVAPLNIRTSPAGGYHYFVKIVNAGTNQEIGSYFIRSGGTLNISVPLGVYEIKYATGKQWYGHNYLFGPETAYNKADSLFTFRFDGYQYSGYTVELIMQKNGNLRTSGIQPNQW